MQKAIQDWFERWDVWLMLGVGAIIRLPSAIFSITSVGLIYALCLELFDRQTARFASLILALSPLHIWYAQEARRYTLVGMLPGDAPLVEQAVPAALESNTSVWLVTTDNIYQPDDRGVAKRLQAWGVPVQDWHFLGVYVSRYQRADQTK
ncbi:MAG TPA: glycosyltransferase family 39 protein [Anaerolineales bacterium]|nr:glycosyltransferase family 39 protein [Anaerolineales bacterium]